MSSAQNGYTERFGSLGSHKLFAAVPQNVVRELETKLIISRHKPGSILFTQGQTAEGILFIFEGRVKLSAIAVDAKTALLKIAGPGEVLGLAAVLSARPSLTTAQVTVGPSSIGLISKRDLASAMEKCQKLSEAIARWLATACKESATDTLLLRAPSSSLERLAAALVRLIDGDANPHPSDTARQLMLTYTHAELAQLIGATRETVTRLMKTFERRGLLKTKHATFQVNDFEALREIARLN